MSSVSVTPHAFTAATCCPRDGGELAGGSDELACTSCGSTFAIRDGVLVLLVETEDETYRRYAAAYEQIAQDDLETPFEYDRSSRHGVLIDFIGDVRRDRVLDVGSSDAAYLQALEAEERVALDLALPFLDAIPAESGIVRVCADAETLPVRPGYFDTIVLSDVLEHVLDPDRVVARLKAVCRADTRVIVHVPWEEDLAKYEKSPYEFTHLRSFNDYTFATLWRDFAVRRRRSTYPILEEPLIFHLGRALPTRIYDRLLRAYFQGSLLKREYERRARWIAELPKRERLLLLFYPPAFRMFELRLRPEFVSSGAVRDRPRASGRRRL